MSTYRDGFRAGLALGQGQERGPTGEQIERLTDSAVRAFRYHQDWLRQRQQEARLRAEIARRERHYRQHGLIAPPILTEMEVRALADGMLSASGMPAAPRK